MQYLRTAVLAMENMNHRPLPESKAEKEFWRAQRSVANEILWDDWDPIGIRHLQEAPTDEYSRYASRALSMARAGKSASEISDYLHDIACNFIGLSNSPKEKSDYAASKIAKIIIPKD